MDMDTAERHELHTIPSDEKLYTVHVMGDSYEFMFGSAFGTDGELLAQQFEKNEERISLT